MKSNKIAIAAARQAADRAATASGNNESDATRAANADLTKALDAGTVVDRMFR